MSEILLRHLLDAHASQTKAIEELTFGGEVGPAEPPWMLTARQELGVAEIEGPNDHNARILAYLATCSEAEGGNLKRWGAGRDETAWCSAFDNWVMKQHAVTGTRSARARSWEQWGVDSPLRPGAIIVLSRKGGGHVGFLVSACADGMHLLGGNQSNMVSIKRYPYSRLLACRWPSGVPQ